MAPIALHPKEATWQNSMPAKKFEKFRVGRKIKRPPVQDSPQDTSRQIPIIRVGALADGFSAFVQFFVNMPPESGMASNLVSHLDPSYASCWNKTSGRIRGSTKTSWNMTIL
jgi:chemotaxis response regulator CheB